MTTIGDRRWIVEPEIEGENGEPPTAWCVVVEVCVGIDEYEPGFPVLDVSWEQDHAVDPVWFDDEAEAEAYAERRNGDTSET